MYLLLALILLGTWFMIKFINWKRNVYDPVKKLPSFGYPIIGWYYKLQGTTKKDIFKTMNEICYQYGPVFRHWNGVTPQIHIFKPECIESICSDMAHNGKGYIYDALHPWLGDDSVFLGKGERWQQIRKLLTPTFYHNILEIYMEVFSESAETLLRVLDRKSDGQPFDIYPDMSHCALDIICETIMGVKVNTMTIGDNAYMNSIHGVSETVVWRMMRPFVNDFIYQFLPQSKKEQKCISMLHNFTEQVIAERREFRKRKSEKILKENSRGYTEDDEFGMKKRMCSLDVLLELNETGEFLTDENIRQQVEALIFGGHDTTASNMSMTLFLLGNYPEIQEIAFEEVRSVLGGKIAPSSISELHELRYLEYVIKESLRLYPSVPLIMRKLSQETEIEGCKVPAGMEIVIQVYELQNSPDYYPNPEKFMPERFFPENCAKRHPYSYIPFSAGSRNCLGQKLAMYEEKTVMAALLNRYKIISMETQKDIFLLPDLVLRPMNGVNVILQKRK